MNTKFITAALVLLLALFCFWSYGDLIGLGWLGQDSVTAVESSRFTDVGDAFALFQRSLMQDTGFPFHYYRPVTCLSFGLNHLLAGSDAGGYHVVDLLILLGIGLCVFASGIWMPRQGRHPLYVRLTAFGAALLFTSHTVNLSVVPVIARRSEGQVVLFGFAALLFTLAAFRKQDGPRPLYLIPAALCIALSFFSKEAGMLYLPPAILIAAFHLRGRSRKKNLLFLLAPGVAAVVLLVLLVSIRNTVIQIPFSHNLLTRADLLWKTTWDFLLSLVYPVRFFGFEGRWCGQILPLLLAAVPMLILGCVLVALIFRALHIVRPWALLLSCIASVLFLILLLIKAMQSPYDPSAEISKIWEANYFIAGPSLSLLFLIIGLLIAAAALIRTLQREPASTMSDTFIVLCTWLFCAWLVVALTGKYTYRNTLGPAAVLALLALLSLDVIVDLFRNPSGRMPRLLAAAGGAALLFLSLTLLGYSHPIRQYGEWKDLDSVATPFMEGLIDAAEADGLQGVEEIGLKGVPGRCDYVDRYSKAVYLAGFTDYTMQSWFRMRLPHAPPIRILKKGRKRLRSPGEKVRISSERDEATLVLTASYIR